MYIEHPSIQQILESIQQISPKTDEIIGLFFGEKTDLDYALLVQELNKAKINFFGGLFPGVIHNTQNADTGLVLSKYPSKNIQLIENLTADINPLEIDGSQKKTAMILVDGLSANIAVFLNNLYGSWGNKVNYIGGGAGSLSLQQSPCIICNKGLLQDVAVVAILDYDVELGVRHGWEYLKGPIVATQTNKNIIEELNWEPAFDIYKEIVEEDSGLEINAENFFDIAKGYPFGMSINDNEAIVRDPITVGENGELICVGEVDNNAVLNILKGKNDSLVDSAKQAANDVLNKTQDKQLKDTFVVDCISRILFLQDDFSRELDAITQPVQTRDNTLNVKGILSLGEISSKGNSPIYFYNKTMVLGAFCNEA